MKYKIGDMVNIHTVSELIKIRGIDICGNIDEPGGCVSDTYIYAGHSGVITEVGLTDNTYKIYVKDIYNVSNEDGLRFGEKSLYSTVQLKVPVELEGLRNLLYIKE